MPMLPNLEVLHANTLELTGQIGPEDFLRRYGVDPLVPLAAELVGVDEEKDNKRQRATVDEECPKCGNPEMEYYTLQLRSADEGQTVFYECPKCKFKFSHNN
ncbi:hypothetical protein CBR_g23850 [Chara braunii]|uniref:DNA-directed RNA polymerase I subunit RPA12 n=1 Tax=Chara braunii TaxID=69332 RepID=A0A388L580_CHABU|nr:hypothetical protein CBR_g23850 [Chara braunii]|eukprot:GBG77402.1 hypothetical protein CBR_g23850 [Chara braunii]